MCNLCDDDWHDSRDKALEKAAWKDWDEVPHRKAGKYTKKKRSDHKHIMAQERVEVWGWSTGGKYRVIHFNCIVCMNMRRTTYDWNYKD